MRLRAFCWILVASVIGCGDSPGDVDAGQDAAPAAAPFVPADHPAPPTVVSLGGAVLAAPTFVPIVYASDADRGAVEDFAAAMSSTPELARAVAEYGVGGAKTAAPIVVQDAAPATVDDGAIRAWIAAELGGASPAWGKPDPSAIYTVFYPAGTTVTQGGSASCVSWSGYHDELVVGAVPIVYAVVPRCSAFHFAFATTVGLDLTTSTAFHEWIEAATDPHPFTAPAYARTDLAHIAWTVFPGGELGDMCASTSGAVTTPPDLAHAIQRTWSNASAAAGHDPCLPHVSSEPYFNSAPVLPDAVTLGSGASAVKNAIGVRIPIGQSKTIEVDLFSDAPTSGPWSVSAMDLYAYYRAGPSELDFAWDATTGENGDKLHLTITAKTKDPNFGAEPFVIVSTLGDETTTWFGIVAN